jgi:hypothetical protein
MLSIIEDELLEILRCWQYHPCHLNVSDSARTKLL